MIWSEIKYSQTKNTGNYENERLEVVAELEPGDDPSECLNKLKYFVHGELRGYPGQPQQEDDICF